MEYGKKIIARFEPGIMGVSMYIFENLPTGRFVLEPAGELKKRPLKEGTAPSWKPTMHLEDELALQLYLELDKIYGKERAQGDTATLEATRHHLQDLQKLIPKLAPPKPNEAEVKKDGEGK